MTGESEDSGVDNSDASSESSESERVICGLCNKSFHNKYNLQRHIATVCESAKIKEMLSNPVTANMLEKAYTMQVDNSNHINSGHCGSYNNGNMHNGDNNNIINNGPVHNGSGHNIAITTNNNSLTQNIQINPIGKETLDHISKERRLEILQKGIGAVPALFRAITEIPENINLVICDKRNSKAIYRDRDGEIMIGDLDKAIMKVTTDNIDRIDSFLDELYGELRLRDKSILRLIEAQSYVPEGEERDPEARPIYYHENIHGNYHIRVGEQIRDYMDLKKKQHMAHLTKYIEQMDAHKLT